MNRTKIKKCQIMLMIILLVFSQSKMIALPVLAESMDSLREEKEFLEEKEIDEPIEMDSCRDEKKERTEYITTETGEIQYIVHVEEKKKYESVKEKCDGEIETGYEKDLRKTNYFVAQMSPKQAEVIDDMDGVEVEKDFVLTGAEEEKREEGYEDEIKAINQMAEDEWNIKMVNSEQKDDLQTCQFVSSEVITCTGSAVTSSPAIKVAVLDSGRTFSSDVIYEGGCNLIDPETDPYGMDLTTHGVGVAGIIAAKDNGEMTTGVGGNVAALYSVKVLDGNNETTVSRLIAGIQWCINNDINIINMSMGTPHYSSALEEIMKKAEKKGILMIASVGNTGDTEENQVEYPAAFKEVIGVGAVNEKGERSSFSATGEGVEIMAPGENIPLASLWNGVTVGSGTSFATPHVTGIAARLWAKNPNKPADFIRCLLRASCKELGDVSEYGFGLLDYEYAVEMYEELEKKYKKQGEECVKQFHNDTEVEEYELPEYVKANWKGDRHQNAVTSWGDVGLSDQELAVVAVSAMVSDHTISSTYNLKSFGALHAREKTNYVSAVKYLMNIAVDVYFTDSTIPSIIDRCKYKDEATLDRDDQENSDNLKKAVMAAKDYNFGDVMRNEDKNKEYPKYTMNKKKRALQVLGLALHVAQDTYAHRAQVTEDAIPHLEAILFKDYDLLIQQVRAGRVGTSDLNKVFAHDYYEKSVHSTYADNPEFFVDRYNIGIPWITSTIMSRFCDKQHFSSKIFHSDTYFRRTEYLKEHVRGVYDTLSTGDGMTSKSWSALSFYK